MEFRINMSGKTLEDVERGNQPPDGYYHVRLDDTYEDHAKHGQQVFKYVILSGVCEGKVLFDRLDDPANAKDATEQENKELRVQRYFKRLGLLGSADEGQDEVMKDPVAAVGNEYVVRVTSREGKDKLTGKASGQTFSGVDYFNGVFPLDYPKYKLPRDFPADLKAAVMTGPETDPKKAGNGSSNGGNGGATAGTTGGDGASLTAPRGSNGGNRPSGRRRDLEAAL